MKIFKNLYIHINKTLLKRLKEKKPYCSVEQWKKDRLITEVYLRNISSYPENYPIRQKSQPRHVPPIKKNENEELKREKSPLEGTGINYSGGKLRGNRTRTAGSCNVRKNNRLNDNSRVSGLNGKGTKKSKYRTMSESTRQSYKLDTSINQNQVDRLYLEQKKNGKLYRVPENDTTTAFDRVLNNYEKVDSDIKGIIMYNVILPQYNLKFLYSINFFLFILYYLFIYLFIILLLLLLLFFLFLLSHLLL